MTATTKIRNQRSPIGERRVQIPVSFRKNQIEELQRIALEKSTTISRMIQDDITKKYKLDKLETSAEAKQ